MEKRWGFPGGASGKEPICQCGKHKECGFGDWVGNIPWRKAWQTILVFLTGESHGQRSLMGPQGHKELDTTEATSHSHTQRSGDGGFEQRGARKG